MKTINRFILSIMIALMSAVAISAVDDFSVQGQTPTQREDNTGLGLTEISGFNMYCGADVLDYQNAPTFFSGATLPNTTWLITGLPVGTHYCAFTTVDIDGRESTYSNYVTLINVGKAIPKPPFLQPGQVIRAITTTP